jgi:hypothetical protein
MAIPVEIVEADNARLIRRVRPETLGGPAEPIDRQMCAPLLSTMTVGYREAQIQRKLRIGHTPIIEVLPRARPRAFYRGRPG